MEEDLNILFVEDVINDAELVWYELSRNKLVFSKHLVDNEDDYVRYLNSKTPDIIISDFRLPHFDGLAALAIRNRMCPLVPFLLVTGSINEEVAVECMKSGADDYILKENLARLGPAVISSLEKHMLAHDKKVVEDDLLKSQIRLQRAQSIAHVGNWEVDLSTNQLWCSEESRKIYGLDPDQQSYSFDFIKTKALSEYRPQLDEAQNRLLLYNEPYDIEFRIHPDDSGAEKWVYSRAEREIDPETGHIRFVGVIQDITDRKLSEESLAFNNMLLRTQQESSIDGILVIDNENKVINFNRKLVELWNIPEDIQNAKSNIPLLEHNANLTIDPQGFYERVKEIYTSPDKMSQDEVILKDGRIIERYSSPMFGKDNKYHGRIWYFRDISYRKKVEDEVRQERRMLRTLIDNIPYPIYVEDANCRKVIANLADVQNIGANCESEVLGKTDIEIFPQGIGERGYINDKYVIDSGKAVFNLEEEFIGKDGKKKWLQTTKIPLHDKDGNINGLVGIGHDITERKETEAELIRAKDKAEESDRLKTAFLHNISHEIRTPMNAIVGFSALLDEPDIDSETKKSYIDVIMQSSNHLLSIITDIVDISNIEANLIKIAKSEINLNHTLKTVCNQFAQRAFEKKVFLSCPSSLPDDTAIIVADRTKLIQILSNLVGNALKFTDKGQVKVTYNFVNGFIEFNVTDTGIGIDPQYHAKVFDRFYQVNSNVSRLYEGTGLGLAISKAYVELMGGSIWLESEPGKGTSFHFTIPLEKPDNVTKTIFEKKTTEKYSFSQKRLILVAEDIESNYKLISFFLSDSNVELLHALNGKEAVEKFRGNSNIDLILMDIKMPEMDGYSAVRIIRESNTSVPIIAQTAYADDKEKAMEAGCNGFISKPFNRKELFGVLSDFI